MSVEVGTAVFHRTRGVGRVIKVENRRWQGEETRYLVVEMMANEDIMRIPETSPHLRRVLSNTGIIFRTLHQEPQRLAKNYRSRQAEIRDALKSGEPEKVAAAARDIRSYAESEQGNWTRGGKRLYERALRLLASEVAASQGCDLSKAKAQITDAMLGGESGRVRVSD